MSNNNELNIGYFSRSSEIMNDFVSKLAKPEAPPVNKDQVLKDFESFEQMVQTSPKMIQVFAALQKRFSEDPDYAAKVDPNFVAGVMMLNLPEPE